MTDRILSCSVAPTGKQHCAEETNKTGYIIMAKVDEEYSLIRKSNLFHKPKTTHVQLVPC